MNRRLPSGWLAAFALPVVVLASSGCQDDPFCFTDCDVTASGSGGQGQGGAGVGGDLFSTSSATGGAGGGACVVTNGGEEICDQVDNDCDGEVDEDSDFNGIQTCGTCQNNCFAQLLNVDPTTITCTWDGTPNTPGVCAFTDCASDYIDLDPSTPGCEYPCSQTAMDDATCNNKDDDCDGMKDEDIDLCTDASNCGSCGTTCNVAHGTGQCASSQTMNCNPATSQCEIATCNDDDNDSLPDWHDLDNSYATGCEYNCEITNGGIEICGDAIDNDCDGAIDGSDTDLTGDPQLGQQCFGDPDGLCADASHAGATVCIGQQVLCQGPNVLIEGQVPETCNGIDDDCDGVPDDNPIDAGGSCGVNNTFPCSFGTQQCQGGTLVCVGSVNPGVESCNGIDDDCDGVIDSAMGNPPADAVGPCNQPTPPPMGATSPCSAGTLACQAGAVNCVGWTGPSGPTDSCGDDSNCDGLLSNQPDLTSSVSNCGACGNDCYAGSLHEVWLCQSSACVYQGCQLGFYDLNNDQICEYACVATGGETCNGIDDDCNGIPDDGLTAPSAVQVCGVSPAATRPECTTGVGVACVSGSWQCSFPAGVCSPNCASAVEVCDAYDNDCDGGFNENVTNFGQSCKSDDGLPPPGHGACQTSGLYVCNGLNATQCSATPASCATLPGGCTEACDGVDNDCDGLVDEDYTDKGPNTAFFMMPAVTQIGASLWITSFEASRPNATPTSAGTGNGYHCGQGCAPLPNAPGGKTLDDTIACSVPDNLPWFNVSPIEVEQTCDAIGGFICDTSEWQQACEATQNCNFGYNPRGAPCLSPATASKFCNLGPFDFDSGQGGDQDGLLGCGSPSLLNCWADWSNLFANTSPQVYDITGNLREITKAGSNVYPLLGGSYVTPNEGGATCDFDFFAVDQNFQLLDTGFRCCFASDPRL